MTDRHKNTGISPAVGVILLIGLSVATATLAGIVLLDIGDKNLNNSVNAGVEISETPDGVEVSWNNQGNAEEVKVQVNGETVSTLGTVNDNITLGVDKGETVSAVGISEDSEQVLQEQTTNQNTNSTTGNEYTVKDQNIDGQTVTGTVTLNPPIEGASVKIIDSKGNVVSSTTTDSQGKFSTVGTPGDKIKVVVDGDISYNGRDVYASKTQTVSSSDVTIDFDQSKLVAVGSSKSVVNNGSIGSAVEIQAIPDNSSKEYTLLSDIDASSSNIEGDFTPAQNFAGVLNGNGHTISNLSISKDVDGELGLFETIDGGTVKNITFNNATVEIKDGYIGVVAGKTTGSTLIKNVHVSNSTVKGHEAGGLVGRLSGSSTVTLSSATDVSLDGKYSGGIIGENNGTLTKSYSLRTSFTESYAGLLVGDSRWGTTISNSYARDMGEATGIFGDSISSTSLIGTTNGPTDMSNVYNTSGRIIRYYDKGVVNNSYHIPVGESAGTSLSKYKMVGGTAEENMKGFDFETVWKKPDKYKFPTLQDNPEKTPQSEADINKTLYNCKDVSYSTNGSGALEIDSAMKLQCIEYNPSDTDYVLTSDIDTSSISNFTPIKYKGTLDGNGHTVSNLSISTSKEKDIGLFETLSNGTVKNINFDSATVESVEEYGVSSGVVAANVTDNSTIENVHVSNSTVKGHDSGGIVGDLSNSTVTLSSATDVSLHGKYSGGLIGRHNGKLKKSYSLRTSFTETYAGLLVGNARRNATISNSYGRELVEATGIFGDTMTETTLIGNQYGTDMSNVYNTAGGLNRYYDNSVIDNGYHIPVDESDGTRLGKYHMVGGTAEENMTGFDFETVWKKPDKYKFPTLQDNPEKTPQSEADINKTLYNCKDVSYSTNGSGALEIDNATKLQCIESKPSDTDYVLTSDIDASSIPNFTPIKYKGVFTGTLDGNGHTVSNLSITTSKEKDIGLFYAISDGKVNNINFDSATVEAGTGSDVYAGVVAANMTNNSTIENVHVSNATVKGYHAGGIVANMSNSTVTLSSATDVELDGRYGGGIIGRNSGTLSKSYSLQIKLTNDNAGLLVGNSRRNATISNSYSRDMIEGTDQWGDPLTEATLIGSNYGTDLYDVYNTSGGLNRYYDISDVDKGYYNSDSISSSSSGTGLTTSEMQGSNASSNMTGFDFTSVWNTRTGDYPELKNNPE